LGANAEEKVKEALAKVLDWLGTHLQKHWKGRLDVTLKILL